MTYVGFDASAGGGFNPFSAGSKQYGGSGRSNPTMGPVDPTGYMERDLQGKTQPGPQPGVMGSANTRADNGAAKRQAILNLLQQMQKTQVHSPGMVRGLSGGAS